MPDGSLYTEPRYLHPGDMVRLVQDVEDADFCLVGTRGSLGIVIPFEDYLERDQEITKSFRLSPADQQGHAARLALDQEAIESCRLYPVRFERIKPPEAAVLRNHCGHLYSEKGSVELIQE